MGAMACNASLVGECFTRSLTTLLRRRNGGRIPRISALTKEFNQAWNWADPISPETFRRWLRGTATPELHRFIQLCAFLKCSPQELLTGVSLPGCDDVATEAAKAGVRSLIDQLDPLELSVLAQLLRTSSANGSPHRPIPAAPSIQPDAPQKKRGVMETAQN
ncbi:MAG: helix-turn-helix transcriptional regulator [Rhodocyclaceae bacterium]|nr:helix-turn-helix transcriptional regulator [Rhodocyclaceae bacterium]